jgi:RNA polymerase sigma-70 factor (ECF subfamily)
MTDFAPIDEKGIIDAFRAGDQFAFVTLYNRHKGHVYAFCLKMLLNEEMARDALQETFLRVFENRDRLLKTDAFRSWLFTIARNQCFNTMRRDRRTVPLRDADSGPPASTTPATQLERSEQAALVNHFIGELKVEYREVLILREYQNMSYEEIAAVTRTTTSSVKSRLFKARRKLAEFLEPWLETKEPVMSRRYRGDAQDDVTLGPEEL